MLLLLLSLCYTTHPTLLLYLRFPTPVPFVLPFLIFFLPHPSISFPLFSSFPYMLGSNPIVKQILGYRIYWRRSSGSHRTRAPMPAHPTSVFCLCAEVFIKDLSILCLSHLFMSVTACLSMCFPVPACIPPPPECNPLVSACLSLY